MDDPRTMAVLQGVAGLLGARGGLQGITQGLLGYQGAMQQAKQQAAVEQMRQMQLEQHAMQLEQARKAAAQQELDRSGLAKAFTPISGIEANRASGITGPRPEALSVVGQTPKLDPRAMLSQGMSPEAVQQAFALSQLGKPAGPLITKAGDVARDPTTGKVLWQNDTAESVDPFIRMLKQSGIDPASPQGQAIIRARIQKETTHAPGTNVNVNAGPKAFDADLGKFAVDAFAKQRESAQAAAGVLQSIGEIRKAVQGGAYQGAGAELKLGAAKALGALGMPYDANTVANTELFNAQAKSFVLNTIKTLGPNPSNADREFIEQTIPRLQTDPTALPQLLAFMERKAGSEVTRYNANAKKVQSRADYLPFSLEVQVPEVAPAPDGLTPAEQAELADLRARIGKR